MRSLAKVLEPNSYAVGSPFPFLCSLTAASVEQLECRKRPWRAEGVGSGLVATGVCTNYTDTTIVRLSLNDANKFDYFCFQILPRPPVNAGIGTFTLTPRVENTPVERAFSTVRTRCYPFPPPTSHPTRPQRREFILRLNRKLVSVWVCGV